MVSEDKLLHETFFLQLLQLYNWFNSIPLELASNQQSNTAMINVPDPEFRALKKSTMTHIVL